VTSEEQGRVEAWLRYFSDLGFSETYRNRGFNPSSYDATGLAVSAPYDHSADEWGAPEVMARVAAPEPSRDFATAAGASSALSPLIAAGSSATASLAPLPILQSASLFERSNRVEDDSMEKIRETIGDCTRCRLHERRNKIVFGVGNTKAQLVFIGEGPGRDEDVQGEPFVGRAGKLLTQMIEAMGLRRENVYICNVVKCRPPENRTPEKDEMKICSQFLLRQLGVIKPKAIVCLGNVAAQALLGPTTGVSRTRGQWFDFAGSRLMPTYHPAYLLRNPAAKSIVWADLQLVMAFLGLQLPRSAKLAQPPA
jgi:DNA polymerase